MEQPSSSSKVTVEYFDPHGVYRLLSPGLLPRLPLRNLHWESHAGPLRSISSLHIDLVPSAHNNGATSSEQSAASKPNLSRVRSQDSTVGEDGFQIQSLGQSAAKRTESRSRPSKDAVKERRHQIPGLRQTPYLKVFFLRCDDNDTYKAQSRKEVRDWIKEHTQSSSSSKQSSQENHDAYEWLIIHVIVPNTAAATQPRTSGKRADGSSGSAAEKATTRWRGGGSTTILEKLRADFNSSSKSAPDRIAQIRIGINDVPYEMLPRVVPAIPGSYSETVNDNENAWLDLITKLKFLILSSFDMRVGQYEEDVREKDAQRALPGWNFCTFFVLKEGLARGFESVGLVEDALVDYDELAVGLDTVIREKHPTGAGAEHGGSFLPFTEELMQQAEKAKNKILRDRGVDTNTSESDSPIDLQRAEESDASEDYEIPLNSTKKNYRELILSNDVSVFDFRCYLFARQLSLLLRRANAWSSQEELLAKLKEERESSLQGVAARNPTSKPAEDIEDLSVLSEVCRRAMAFITSISRIMRDDLWAGNATLSSKKHDPLTEQVIENIVSSFTFAITQQILAQTSTKSLPIPPSTLAPANGKIGLDGHEPKAAIPEPKTLMHPARSTSLALRPLSQDLPPSPGLFPSGRRSSLPDARQQSSSFLKVGLEELAAHRAELYLLSRSLLAKVGKERGWSVGWDGLSSESDKPGDMEDVDLEESQAAHKNEEGESKPTKTSYSLHGIESKLLRTAIDNQEDFYRLYETLTDKALRHYTVANHSQSVQACMADLAVLEYHLADYAAAASYFFRMKTFYGDGGWTQVETSMLKMYATCLKKLQRKEDYIHIVLKLLSKAAEVEQERLLHISALRVGLPSGLNNERVEVESYLSELLELTKSLQHEINIPLENFFGRVDVIGAPQYAVEKDGVSLQIRLRYLLSEDITVDKARVRLVALQGDVGREVWMETESPTVLKTGYGSLQVQTNTIVPGVYVVSHISVYASNIILHWPHETSAPSSGRVDAFFKSPKLLIYHRTEAFDIKLFASRYLHLDRNRSLEIELSSGWNNVISGELQVRPATAGLRLQTSEAKVVRGSLEISRRSEPGIIRFGSLKSESRVKLRMPFNLEYDVSDVALKLEITYTTEKGKFLFATTPSISIMLPLGVNVQDVFKHKALFSKFTVTSSTSSPLRLLSSKLDKSDVFEAECGVGITKPVVVFPRQPASVLYKITKISRNSPMPANARKPLSITLHYICLEEEIDHAVTLSLTEALKGTPLYLYTRLVIPTVLARLRSSLSPYELEKIAILNEVPTSILSLVRWQDYFSGLGRLPGQEQDTSVLLSEQLELWRKERPSISLVPIPLDQDTISNSRSIIIPVDVPSVTVVHTADLQLLETSSVMSNTSIAAVNQPISASLQIKHTNNWNTESALKEGRPQSSDAASSEPDYQEFVYEVSAPSDTWLIGGRRKGHFRVPTGSRKKGMKHTFPIVLVPLREGYLHYPNVDIHPAPVAKVLKGERSGAEATDGGDANISKLVVTCETDYKNCGETIRVISDARKTTVSLDASGPQGGAWLLETERRGNGVVQG
ncbi:Trafficking protein particle complex subunit 10 [Phlyctema vagabunda]|uniref:Trafficking protein particle complex subunit 10 n=1 Tax=Phlyctema vagabunda TaxID=108571 RepID=A0ABR4PK80_9HELO